MLRIRARSSPLACRETRAPASRRSPRASHRPRSTCNHRLRNSPSALQSLAPAHPRYPNRIRTPVPIRSQTLFHLRVPSRNRVWALRLPINPSPCPCEQEFHRIQIEALGEKKNRGLPPATPKIPALEALPRLPSLLGMLNRFITCSCLRGRHRRFPSRMS